MNSILNREGDFKVSSFGAVTTTKEVNSSNDPWPMTNEVLPSFFRFLQG